MKQDIASPLSGTYKAVNSSLVYTIAEVCCLLTCEFSRKSTRNKSFLIKVPSIHDTFLNCVKYIYDNEQ